jgi:hypothetical protein
LFAELCRVVQFLMEVLREIYRHVLTAVSSVSIQLPMVG